MGTTQPEQLDWLDEAREADADPGFPDGMAALCSLPLTDQRKFSHYVRANCPFPLAMTAVGPPRRPCGNLPRLLLALVCSEAGRTGRRNLMLGKSLLEFMGRLGNNNDGSVHRRRRARSAHSPPDTGADARRSKAGRLRLSVRLMSLPPYPASFQVTAGPPPFPYRFTAPSFSWAFWLPPAARLALDPLGRRKPAARTLTLAQRGVCHCLAHAALARPCTWLRFVLPAIGFGRCRQSWVSGKRSQTLNA